MTKLRIALYTHSTNPRGGVVHTLELGNALAEAGHNVTIHAPDPTGHGFFRRTAARHVSIDAAPARSSLPDMIDQRIREIAAHIRGKREVYDIYHAQDSINANALAACLGSGHIRNFIRTVHHVDHYEDEKISCWQRRGIQGASKCFCVSNVWQQFLNRDYNIQAEIVPNGVSLARFSPEPNSRDISLRRELGIGNGPVYLAIGGVEARKNTINILGGFKVVAAARPQARLVIAGGASLLDHSAYQTRFHTELAASGLAERVILAGPVADTDMPSLYRIADALVFPSVREGFGLVVLEALAAATPVIVSRIAPFTEYLTDQDCSFADPHDPVSIGTAMLRGLSGEGRREAIAARRRIALPMGWPISAARQASLYEAALNEDAQNEDAQNEDAQNEDAQNA